MSGTKFSYRRRVDFGDCDSARVYFTPRAVDYAVEGVEAWYEDVLGVSWADLVIRHNLDPIFVQIGCEYFRPVIADQIVHVLVKVVGIDRATITFSAVGQSAAGETFFRVTLQARFSEGDNVESTPIPARYRQRIEACLVPCDGLASTPMKKVRGFVRRDERNPCRQRPQGPAGMVPFTSQRLVVFGDCTVSGTVYAPRIFNYAVEAVGEWYRETLGISWLQQCIRQRGVPFMDIRCECLTPLVPRQVITMAVTVPRLGSSSIGYDVLGYDETGKPCFDVRMSACYISDETGSFKATPFPEEMRARILAYQAACEHGDRIRSTSRI